MRTKIQKWGNSLGLRIPKSFAEEVRVEAGSTVDITVDRGRLIIRLARRNKLEGALRWIYLLLLIIASVVVGFGGHLGGQLVYGEQHLPF